MYQEDKEGLWYWYGTTKKEEPGWISKGVNLYSSPDLQNWEFEGQIFQDSQIKEVDFGHPYRIERPKVGDCDRPDITLQVQAGA
jgi:sucrose-6-phosphate hydrolase SacC (GH32 family)